MDGDRDESDLAPDVHLDVRQDARGNEFHLTLRSPQHVAGLARLAALLAAKAAPFASRMELLPVAHGEAQLRFTADRRELSKWAMGGMRREALLALAWPGD